MAKKKNRTIDQLSTVKQAVSSGVKQAWQNWSSSAAKQTSKSKWYSGDAPTNRETLARIYTVSGGDRERFDDLYKMYQLETQDRASPLYTPYSEATTYKAINALRDRGYDVSKIDDHFFKNYEWLKNEYRTTANGYGAAAPTKSSTDLQNDAYYYMQLLGAEERTKAAETELAGMADEVQYYVSRGYSDAAVIQKVQQDFDTKYGTLSQMDADRIGGEPTLLNRATGYNADTIYGMIYAARNGGGSGDWETDAIQYALGRGSVYRADPASEAAHDPTSIDYDPYSYGSNMDELNMRYGVDSFGGGWLENNRGAYAATEDGQRDGAVIERANANAAKGMSQLTGLMYDANGNIIKDETGADMQADSEGVDQWIAAQVSGGRAAQDIVDELTAMLDEDDPNGLYNSDWAMLADMERARRRGAKVDIGFAVPFTLPGYTRKIEEMCAERDAQAEAAAEAEETEAEETKETGKKYRQKLYIAKHQMARKYGKLIGGVDEGSAYSIGQRAYYDDALEAARRADETGDAKDIETAEARIKAYKEAMAIGSEEWRAEVAEQQKESGAYKDSYAWQYTVGAAGQAYTGLSEVAAVDSELDDDDIQRISHMAETGIWDQSAYNAMARSVDGKVQAEAQFRDELLTGIEKIISGRMQETEKSKYWLAQAWVDEHAGMIAPYMLKTEVGDFIPHGGIMGGSLPVFSYNDWETAYGTDIADALTALHDAQKIGAIDNDTYLDGLIRMTEVCDAVRQMNQDDRLGDANAAAERIREQDGGEAFFSAVGEVRELAEEAARQLEEANGLKREQNYARGREVVAALQNGTLTQEDADWLNENGSGIRLEDVCKGDTGYNAAVSAAEKLMDEQLWDEFASGRIQAEFDAKIDADYANSDQYEGSLMNSAEGVRDAAFVLMASGVSDLIRRDLNQDMLRAEICGMTLDDYYAAYPTQNKSPEARVQAATEEYKREWLDASDAFTDILRLGELSRATESIERSGGYMAVEEKLRERDAEIAEAEANNPQDADPVLAAFETFVGGFASVAVIGTENFLIWAGNAFTSSDADISDRLYDKYNGDAAAYVKDLKAYAEVKPEMRDYIDAALDSNLNAFDIVVPGAGVSLGLAKAKTLDQQPLAQSQQYIRENGSPAVQLIAGISNMLGSTAAMAAETMTLQAVGTPAKLATIIAELGEASGTAVDVWENGGDWNVAQHTVIPLATALGWIEGNQVTARVGDMIAGNGLTQLLARGRREAGFKGLITSLIKNPGDTMKGLLAGARQMLGAGVNNAIEEVAQDAAQFLTEEGVQAASGNQSIGDALNNTFIGHLDDYINTFLMSLAGEPFIEAGFDIAGRMSGVQTNAYDADTSAPIADQVAAAQQSAADGYSDARATNAWLDADAIQAALVQEQDAISALAQGETAAAVTEAQTAAESAHTDWLARRREENEASALWTEASNRLSALTEQVIDADVIEPGMVTEMRDAQVAADHAGERYSAAQASAQQAEIDYQTASEKLSEARAAAKAQFDALMQPAIEAARRRALDNATRGMSDAEKARTAEYLELDRQLADAEQSIREAERSAKDAPAGSDAERRAKSAMIAARRIYDRIAERMTEIFESAPAAEDAAQEVRTAEAEAETQTPAAVAQAEQAAQAAADAARANPTNARLQAEADIAAKNLTLAQAQAQLDAERGGIAEGLRGNAQDRAAAVEKHRTLSGAVQAAANDLKAAQAKNAQVDRTQQELADAIADLQNYTDDDLRNPASENYGAAVAAEARLTQASRAADAAAAEAGVRDALSALDANNPDSVNAYRDALTRRAEVYQADLELTERQKAEIERHVEKAAAGSQRAQAILETRQRGDREQAANLLAAAWNEAQDSPGVHAMLREAAGIRTNVSEVTIRNETGATGKAGLTRAYSESAFDLSEDDQMQLQILDALAKDGNVEIVAHPTVSTVPGARNGVYFEGNTIHIGLDAIDRAYVQTGMHEIVHWLRGNNADGYGGVAQTVFDALTRAGEDVSALIREKLTAYAQAGETLDFEAAQEEVVAESAALVLTDQRNMRAFAREHADAFSAFADAFVRFWEKLQNIARSVAKKNKTGEQQALIGQNKALQKIYDALMDAVKVTGEQGRAGENTATPKYSTNRSFIEQIDELRDGTFPRNDHLYVMETPDVLVQCGFDRLPLLMTQKHAKSVMKVTGEQDVNYHGLTRTGMAELPSAIENAIAVIKAPKFDNKVIVFTEMRDGDGKVVIAPIEVDGRGRWGNVEIDANILDTAYGKSSNSLKTMLMNAIMNDEVMYVDKKRSHQLEQSVGVQFPKKLLSGAPIHSIREYAGEVKLKVDEENVTGRQGGADASYSLNQTETDAFKDWFGDWQNDAENASKIVDEDGAPLIVYHGSDAQFNAFDMSKGRSTMDIVGSFFSPWEIDAAGYGENVGAYYLNIRNPAPEGVAYAALNRFKGQNEAGQKARDYLIKMGYDGVNNGGEEFIAFYPNQIKSATDNVGTFDSGNADVRYSINAADRYSYDTLVTKPDIAVTTVNDSSDTYSRDAVIADGLNNAIANGTERGDGSATVFVDDLGEDVIVGKRGLRHGLDRRIADNAPVTEKIGEVLKNSILVNEMDPKRANSDGAYILLGVAASSDNMYYVKSIVNRNTGLLETVDVLYSVNTRKESAVSMTKVPSNEALPLTDSKISVSDLLGTVKNFANDVLSDDVLSKIGSERNSESEFASRLRYSINPAIIDDYNREQFVSTATAQIMESGSRAPAIMRALAQMGEGAQYAYAPNGGTGGGGEYASGTRGMNPNGTGADGEKRSMRNPIEITTDLVRSVNAGLNPSGAKTVNGRGRLSRAVAGFYAPMANYITTDRRYAGQLAVNLHEFGHAISRTQDFSAVPPGYDAEYAAFLSQYPQEARGQEAIAAFAADYMAEPQRARNIAGDAYVDDFEAMLRANPRLNAAIQKARTEIDLWKSATVAERIANSIRDADEAETRSTARSRSLIRRFYGAVFDAADAAKDVSGDLYTAVRYANASRRRADTILTDRMVDYQGNRVGDSLADVLRDAGIHQDNEMDMLTYAVARHAIEWYNEGLARQAENPNASGMEVFADGEVSIIDLRMLVAEYERTNPNAVQGADALVNWWRDFRDTWYVGTGLMTEEMAQELDRKYPNYVPFNRITEKQFGKRGSGRFSIRTARGSTLNIVNPIQSIAKNVASIVNTVSQNEVMRTLYDAYYAQNGGEAAFGDLVTPTFEGREQMTQDVSGANAAVAAMVAAGADANLAQDAYAAIGRLGEIWRATGQGAGANVVGGIDRNGKRFFFQVHDQALFNLLSGSAATMNDGLRAFRAWKNEFTKLTTGSNPLFAIKNLSRDFQASVNTGTWAVTYIDGAIKEIRSLYEVLRKSDTFEEWRAMGGGDHNRYNAESRSDTRDLRNALLGVERGGEIRNHTPAGERITNLLTWEKLNNAIENASRFAEYRFGRHDLSTFEGRREAFLASQDVTTDFGRMGSSAAIRTLCAVVPFMNASLQGTAKDISTIKNLGSRDAQTRARAWEAMGKSVLNIGLTAALQAALIGAFGGDDDDDEEKRKEYGLLAEEMRTGNLVFRLPQEMQEYLGFDRPWVRIPMAQGPLAGALYSLALDAMSGVSGADELSVDLKAAAQRVIGDCLDFSPIWQGVSDMLNNRTWYESNIVSDYLAKSSVQNQYKGDTPALFKFLANAAHNIGIDVAPAALQYVAEQYTGFAGKILIPLLSGNRFTGEYSAEDSLRNLGYAIAKNYTIDPQTSNDVTNAYADAKEVLTSIKTDADNGNPIGALAYSLEQNEVQAAVREAERLTSGSGAVGKAEKELKRLRKAYSAEQNSDHGYGEKALALRELQKEMNACKLAALEAYEEYCLKYINRDGLATKVFHAFDERPRL